MLILMMQGVLLNMAQNIDLEKQEDCQEPVNKKRPSKKRIIVQIILIIIP